MSFEGILGHVKAFVLAIVFGLFGAGKPGFSTLMEKGVSHYP